MKEKGQRKANRYVQLSLGLILQLKDEVNSEWEGLFKEGTQGTQIVEP